MTKIISAAFVLLTVLVGQTVAQSELHEVADKLAEAVKAEKPQWKYRRTGGAFGAKDLVVVESWSFSHRTVSISIVSHDSVAEAQASLKRFISRELNRRALTDLGEEAWGWGPDAAWIALRRRRFTIYIRTLADVDSDPDARTLNEGEKETRRKADGVRLSQEFSRHVLAALGP